MKNDWLSLRLAVVNHPWVALLFGLMVVAGLSTGIPLTAKTVDYRVYFGPNNPDLQSHEEMEYLFEQKEVIFLGVQALEADLFTPEHLTALREVSELAWGLPFAQRVDSVANYRHMRAEGDDIIIEALIPEDGAISVTLAADIKRRALSDTELVGRLLSPDGKIAALRSVNPLPRDDLEHEVSFASQAVYQLVDDIESRYPTLKVHVSGVIELNNAMANVMDSDMRYLYPTAYLAIFICLWLFFRSLVPAIVTFITIGLATVGAVGASGWMGIVMNSASLASLLIIMTLAVADCVHVLTSYYQERRHADRYNALLESLRLNIQPVALTSLTTLIGFLALNSSDSPPFRDLGNIVAAGVVLALLLSVVLLPALVMILPEGKIPESEPTGSRFMMRFANLIIKYPGRIFIAMLVLVAAVLTGLPNNRMGDDYTQYFAPGIPFRDATVFLNENLSGMQQLTYTLDSGETSGVNNPEFIAYAEEFTAWWEAQPEIRKVYSLVSLHKKLNQVFHDDTPEAYRIPESSDLAAQYLFFYEMSLPEGLGLNTLFDQDRRLTRFVVILDNMEAWRLAEINQAAAEWTQNNLPSGMASDGTSIGILFSRISKRNFNSMIRGTSIALGLIAIILILVLRSPVLGMVSMIPNILPLALAFGVWGYIDGRLGMSLAIVGSMSLGIVVDDTVHLLSKYQRARRENNASPSEALEYAFSRVGVALILTTAILTLGFMILAQSAFLLPSSMALLTAITIVLALAIDFLFLPPLLILMDRLKTNK